MYGETFYGRHTAQDQVQWRQRKIKKRAPLRAMKYSLTDFALLPKLVTSMKVKIGVKGHQVHFRVVVWKAILWFACMFVE